MRIILASGSPRRKELLKLIKPLYNKSLKLIRFKLRQDFENEIVKVLLCLNTETLQDKIVAFQ